MGRALPWLTLASLLVGCGFQAGGATVGDGSTPGDDAPPPGDGPRDADIILPDGPEAPEVCVENGFCLRKRITVQPSHVKGGQPLANFPMLVVILNDDDLKAAVRNDGNDIEFTSSDGDTIIPYERQSWDRNTGSLVAWVKVPLLSNTAPTDIYMYYGKSSALDRADAKSAWDGTYHGVWHLDGDAKDYSGENNDGSASGIAFGSPGHIGASGKWEQNTDRITLDDSNSLDAVTATGTFEMWINFVDPDPAQARFQFILTNTETLKSSNANGFSLATQASGNFYFYPWVNNPSASMNFVLAPAPFMANKWHFAAVTYDFPTKKALLFVDGVQLVLATDNVAANWTQTSTVSDWFIGSNPDSTANYFLGSIDELRISSVARTPGWIATEYDNQLAPAQFYSVGPQRTLTEQ